MPTALVLDDSADYQALLGRILKAAGYRVLSARSAEEAWQAVQLRAPDVALVDWNLPGASGVDFARRLRADGRFQRVVLLLLTVNSAPSQQAEGLTAGGFHGFVAKPFKPDELTAKIASLLKRRDA